MESWLVPLSSLDWLLSQATYCQIGRYEIQNNPTMHLYCNSNNNFLFFNFDCQIYMII